LRRAIPTQSAANSGAQVMMKNEFPAELLTAFNGIETNGNPWNISAMDRADWADGLDVRLMSDHPSAEVLYWVGCAASFDDRSKKVARSVVKLLQTAGVENRKQMATGVHGFVAFLKGTLEKNESPAGGPLDDEERATYASDLRLAQRYAAEVAGFQNVMPTIEVEDRLAIRRGDRTIEVRAVGRGC
jgi:hypothetical protein